MTIPCVWVVRVGLRDNNNTMKYLIKNYDTGELTEMTTDKDQKIALCAMQMTTDDFLEIIGQFTSDGMINCGAFPTLEDCANEGLKKIIPSLCTVKKDMLKDLLYENAGIDEILDLLNSDF